MGRLKAVSVRRHGTETEWSFSAPVVEDVVPGEKGTVTLLGGPSFHGRVREAKALPLKALFASLGVRPPADRTPEQLAKRVQVGSQIFKEAGSSEEEADTLISSESELV